MFEVASSWNKLAEKLSGWFEALLLMFPNLFLALLVVAIGAYLARWVRRGVQRLLLRMSGNRPTSELFGTLARVVVVLAATFVALGVLNLDRTVTSLLAGIGVVGLALGFAFQDIAANVMSGIIMVLRRPFDIGDTVEVGGHLGRVRAIELRATELETLDGLSVTVPNKDVFQAAIINYTKTPSRRLDFTIGTGYDDDMSTVRDVVIAAVRGISDRDVGRGSLRPVAPLRRRVAQRTGNPSRRHGAGRGSSRASGRGFPLSA